MKKIIVLIAMFFLIMTGSANAQSGGSASESDVACGMEAHPDGLKVEPKNGDICADDISFQAAYILFSNVYKDPALYPLISFFISDETLNNEFTEFADETMGVSDPIHFLLSAVAVLGWILITFIILLKSWKYVKMIQRTGRLDFQESKGDTIHFGSFLSVLLLLSLPTGLAGPDSNKGPLMLGQSLAIVGALPSIMGGNYIYSTYLSSTEMATNDVPLKEDMLLPVGQNLANNLVEGRLCEMNTRQALMNMNAKANSSFFEGSGLVEWFDYDQESVINRYDKCLSYSAEIESGPFDDSIAQLSLNKSANYRDPECQQNGRTYNQEAFGREHSCLNMTYDFGGSKFADPENLVDGEEWDVWDDESDLLRERFSAVNFYPRFKQMLEDDIRSVLTNPDLSSSERYNRIDALVINASQSVFGSALSGETILREGSNDTKQARHLIVAAYLLGGSVERSGFANFWENGLSSMWSYSHQYLSSQELENIAFGVEVIMEEAKDVADLIVQHHCAKNWANNQSTRQFILDYNTTADDEDEIKAVFSGQEIALQCVRFISEDDWGSTDQDRYMTYATDYPSMFDDFRQTDDGIWAPVNQREAIVSETASYIEQGVIPQIKEDIQVKQFLLSGYSAAVKKAVTDSLVSSLSIAESDEQRDLNLRPRGWGMFGGALLYTGQTQGSSMHMARSLDNVWTVSANAPDGRFIAREAFGEITTEENQKIEDLFSPYESELMLSIGPLSAGTYETSGGLSEDADDEAIMTFVMNSIESLLLGPMDHIKAASGMPADKPLNVGLQECFDGGYDSCVSGAKHPIVALSNFGNEMITNMITIMVTTEILEFVTKTLNSDEKQEGSVEGDEESAGKKKKSFGAKAKAWAKDLLSGAKKIVGGLVMMLVQAVMLVIGAATAVLSFMKPLFATLLIVGIVFAYIIPMMAYLFGFMVMLLFLVSIFVIAFIIPFYIPLKLMSIEKDYQNGFKGMYQDLLGPYLTPFFFSISAVVSWSLIVVIMYALNVTFSLIHHGLGAASGSGIFSSLMFNVFLYIVYFLALFVLFRFGLGLMKSMPDMMKEKLNLKKGNDDSYINSLGFEQYVNATAMQQIAKLPADTVQQLRRHVDKGGHMSMQELRDEVDKAEKVASDLGLNAKNAEERGREDAAKQMAAQESRQSGNDAPPPPGGPAPGPDENGPDNNGANENQHNNGPSGPVQDEPDNIYDGDDAPDTSRVERDESGKPIVPFTRGDDSDKDKE